MADHTVPDHIVVQWRKEFEEMYALNSSPGSIERRGDSYSYALPQAAWQYWLEARRSLVIKLPLLAGSYDVETDENVDVYQRIESQGIRVDVGGGCG